MKVTLYRPGQKPEDVPAAAFTTHLESSQIVQDVEHAARLLECTPNLVDVLACGVGYIAYSIFYYEGESNSTAMEAVAAISGTELDLTNEDEVLQGPVLIVVA
ncbi:hypothetical protein [Hymenobacter antarcticus]|uniref:Uncharacterized protein n=1 Tax=Hymenobacter antarcticus TaxID=486270 RepID=A0ABP7PMT5_9BACT